MRYIAILGLLTLCACTTTEQAMNKLYFNYAGKDVDRFFMDNGPPQSSYKLGNGSTMFRWNSGAGVIPMPGTTTYNATYTTTGMYGTATSMDGYNITVLCELEIVTDQAGKKNIIRTIRPIIDSVGLWQASRCSEFFQNLPEPPQA